MISLNTGSIQVSAPSKPTGVSGVVGKVSEFDDKTPSEMVVFPSDTRPILVVEPGMMLVVTGYNLGTDTKVVFRKILRSNGIPAQGTTGCCPSVTVAHSIRLQSATLKCWKLDQCNPVFVVKTPGSYELDVEGSSADVVVTALSYPMQEINEFTNCNCEG